MTDVADKIRFYCGNCGKRLKADHEKAGRSAKCTNCDARVPVPRKHLSRVQIRLYCPQCGARIRAFADRAGKQIQCTRCDETIRLAQIKKQEKPKTKHRDAAEPREKSKRKSPPQKEVQAKPPAKAKQKKPKKKKAIPPSAYVIPVPEQKVSEDALPHEATDEHAEVAPGFPLLKVMLAAVFLLALASVGGFFVLQVTSPDWLNTRLMRAARDGDVESARRLLLWGADVNSKTPIPQTPLHWAAIKGHTDVVELLIDNGANVNATDENGKTPLLQAVFFGRSDVAQLLIYRNADANVADRNGFTPLYRAAYQGNKELVELLIAGGADLNATVAVPNPRTKQTARLSALDAAILAGHKGVAAFLRRHGAKSME